MGALLGQIRARSSRWSSDDPVLLGLSGPEIVAVLGVALPAMAVSIAIFLYKQAPIWDDGADVLANRIPATLETLVQPFHQHLDFVPILVWSIIGNQPAVLFAVLLATHVALATGTGAFLVRRLGPRPGFALALPLGVLGSAHYDLLMPWQILYTIPLLCGLAATWLSTAAQPSPPGLLGIGGLMIVAVASSNAGLFLVGALGLWYLLGRRWRLIVALLPALGLWTAWFFAIGITGAGTDGGFALTPRIFPYVLMGLASGLGGVTGLSLTYGTAILAGIVGWLIDRRPRLDAAIVAFVVALVVMFASLSLFRSLQPYEDSAASRYIYLFGFFVVFGLGAAAPRIPESRLLVPLSFAAAALNVVTLIKALPVYP